MQIRVKSNIESWGLVVGIQHPVWHGDPGVGTAQSHGSMRNGQLLFIPDSQCLSGNLEKHNSPSRKPAAYSSLEPRKPNPVTNLKTKLEKASSHNRQGFFLCLFKKKKKTLFFFLINKCYTFIVKHFFQNTDKQEDKISHNLTTKDDQCFLLQMWDFPYRQKHCWHSNLFSH